MRLIFFLLNSTVLEKTQKITNICTTIYIVFKNYIYYLSAKAVCEGTLIVLCS
jgi:hypothetical protein